MSEEEQRIAVTLAKGLEELSDPEEQAKEENILNHQLRRLGYEVF